MKNIFRSFILLVAILSMAPRVLAQNTPLALPYTQNFDRLSMTGLRNQGWTFVSGDPSWTLNSGDYQSSTTAHSGSLNLYLFQEGRNGTIRSAYTPLFTYSPQTSAIKVSFWYRNTQWASDYDSLVVSCLVYDGSGEYEYSFDIFHTTSYHGWTYFSTIIDVDPYLNGDQFCLQFQGFLNYGYGICIDDLEVTPSAFIATRAYPTSGGTVLGSGTFYSGTSVTLTATPSSGYHFAYWSDEPSNTSSSRTITATGYPRSYAAVFSPNDNVHDTVFDHVTVNPSITLTVSPHNSLYGQAVGGGTYRANETARLMAIPNEGYHFRRWSDGSTDNPHTVTVKGNKTYYAYFSEECTGSESNEIQNVTACNRYTWVNGVTYTASAYTPTCTLTNRANCDSVLRLSLTIRSSSHTNYTHTACNNYTWHGTTYYTSGTKTYHYNNSFDCPSTETLNLTINHGTYTGASFTACESYTWHGTSYTTSGAKTYTYTNSSSCTSVDTLYLTINKGTRESKTITASDSYLWHGDYHVANGIYTYDYYNDLNCPSTATLYLNLTNRSGLPGLFSVSSTKQVRFASGNLRYSNYGTHVVADGTSATGTWSFATNQYDYIGNNNSVINYPNFTSNIDLFGWGTSGWNSGATAYLPYSYSRTASDYHPSSSNLANTDWGVYNAISNGGNAPGIWRTLTSSEWNYLLSSRATSPLSSVTNARYAYIRINTGSNYIMGLLIFPDTFTWPSQAGTIPPTINGIVGPTWATYPSYTIAQFTALENAGCVFLPAAGYRDGTNLVTVNDRGFYWTSTLLPSSPTTHAYGVNVTPDQVPASVYGSELSSGFLIRLVQDATY